MFTKVIGSGLIAPGAFVDPGSLGTQTIIWLDPSQMGLADNALISTFTNFASNGLSLTAAGAAHPTNKTNIVNGRAIARFDGVANVVNRIYTDFPYVAMQAAGVELYVVLKIVTDPPLLATKGGAWVFGPDGTGCYYPFTNGGIFDSFCTSLRKSVGDPTPSLSSAFRLYNVSSAAGEFTARLDTTQLFTTATNTVATDAGFALGVDSTTVNFMDGDVAAFVVVSPPLSPALRASMEQYMKTRYALTGF